MVDTSTAQSRSAHRADVNTWLVPFLLTIVVALASWALWEIEGHNTALSRIETTIGIFNSNLEKIIPDLNKIHLDIQQEHDRGDAFEKHLEYDDKAIDAFRSTTYYPPGPGHRPTGQ